MSPDHSRNIDEQDIARHGFSCPLHQFAQEVFRPRFGVGMQNRKALHIAKFQQGIQYVIISLPVCANGADGFYFPIPQFDHRLDGE